MLATNLTGSVAKLLWLESCVMTHAGLSDNLVGDNLPQADVHRISKFGHGGPWVII